MTVSFFLLFAFDILLTQPVINDMRIDINTLLEKK